MHDATEDLDRATEQRRRRRSGLQALNEGGESGVAVFYSGSRGERRGGTIRLAFERANS